MSLDAAAAKTAERVLRYRTQLFTLHYTTLAGSLPSPVLYLLARRSVLICHHVLAATN